MSSNCIVTFVQGGPKNRIPSFIFWITSVIQHSFTVTSRNLWRVNLKFFHPPHLYCVTTLPSKTNTTANIGVKCFHFSRNVMLSVGVSRMRKTRVVLSILELTAYTAAKSSSRRVCCLTSEQYVITGGHCSRIERQRTPPGPRWTI